MPEKVKQEIKNLLTEATFWCQTGELDLAVEKIYAVIDREKIKAVLADKSFDELRIRRSNEKDSD